MRIIAIILLAAAIIYCLGARPLLGRPAAKLTALLLGLCLLPSAYFELRWQELQATGSAIVKSISRNTAGHLRCERFSAALLDASAQAGEVAYSNPDEAYVHYRYCQDLRSWLDGDKHDPTLAQIVALHTLVHEAVHVGGDFNEGSTECKALAAEAGAFQELGASATVAAAMHQRYVQEIYPNLTEAYRVPCA